MGSKVLGFVAGFAGVTALTSAAFAQSGALTCTSDDDCPRGQWCASAHASDPEPNSGGATDEPAPAPTRAALWIPPAEGSVCEAIPASVCESDQDCGTGLACVKGQSSGGCGPSVDGSATPCDTSVTTSRYGSCEVKPIECVTDSDCPKGLSCVTAEANSPEPSAPPSSGSGSANGGSTGSTGSATTKAATKYCTFEPVNCETNADCESGYECVTSEVQACSGGTAAPDCAGSVASDGTVSSDCGVSQPQEPECQTVSTEGLCFPKKMPCTSDSECPNEYVCYEFEPGQAPDAWTTSSSSSVMSCLPEGIALVANLEGRDASEGLGDDFGDGDGKGEASGDNGADAENHGRPVGAHGDGSACSVSATRTGTSWLFSGVGLLGLCLARNRLARGRRRRAA